jgi:hypothetical protein
MLVFVTPGTNLQGEHFDQTFRRLHSSAIKLMKYLETAAVLARDKFCHFDITAMVLGCMAMLGALCLHGAVLRW